MKINTRILGTLVLISFSILLSTDEKNVETRIHILIPVGMQSNMEMKYRINSAQLCSIPMLDGLLGIARLSDLILKRTLKSTWIVVMKLSRYAISLNTEKKLVARLFL